MIDIYGWLDFELYDLVWLHNNHSDKTKPMLGWWMGAWHSVGSMLCYLILIKKGSVLLCTTIKHVTDEKPRYPNVQEWIQDYHGYLEAALVSENFGTSLDVYDSFINDNEGGTAKGNPNEEDYQGLPDYLELDEVIDIINKTELIRPMNWRYSGSAWLDGWKLMGKGQEAPKIKLHQRRIR